MRKEILVVDPCIDKPEIESFNLISRMSNVPLSLHFPVLTGMQTVYEAEKQSHCVGAIILGSGASVRDNRDWQTELIDWLRSKIPNAVMPKERAKHASARASHFPILGICFGHQLLAYMHGVQVGQCAKKNLGFRKVTVQKDERLGIQAREDDLFVAHGDKVDAVPEGFEVFASSGDIAIEALRHKTLPIWSFQPHLDANPIFANVNHYKTKEDPKRYNFGNELLRHFVQFLTPPEKW